MKNKLVKLSILIIFILFIFTYFNNTKESSIISELKKENEKLRLDVENKKDSIVFIHDTILQIKKELVFTKETIKQFSITENVSLLNENLVNKSNIECIDISEAYIIDTNKIIIDSASVILINYTFAEANALESQVRLLYENETHYKSIMLDYEKMLANKDKIQIITVKETNKKQKNIFIASTIILITLILIK